MKKTGLVLYMLGGDYASRIQTDISRILNEVRRAGEVRHPITLDQLKDYLDLYDVVMVLVDRKFHPVNNMSREILRTVRESGSQAKVILVSDKVRDLATKKFDGAVQSTVDDDGLVAILQELGILEVQVPTPP